MPASQGGQTWQLFFEVEAHGNASVVIRIVGNYSYPVEAQLLDQETGNATRLLLWPAFRDMGAFSFALGDFGTTFDGELSIAGGAYVTHSGRYAILVGYDAPIDQTITTSWQNSTIEATQITLGSQFSWSRPDKAVDSPSEFSVSEGPAVVSESLTVEAHQNATVFLLIGVIGGMATMSLMGPEPRDYQISSSSTAPSDPVTFRLDLQLGPGTWTFKLDTQWVAGAYVLTMMAPELTGSLT